MIAMLATGSAAAAAAVAAAFCKLGGASRRRAVQEKSTLLPAETSAPGNADVVGEGSDSATSNGTEEKRISTAVAWAPSSIDVDDNGSTTADGTTEDGASPTATPPVSPGNSARPLLMCPWHEGISHFLKSTDLGRVNAAATAAHMLLTVEAPARAGAATAGTAPGQEQGRGKRLLIVPVLELQMQTAEAELRRVSLPHVHVLRVYNRLAFSELTTVLKSCPQGLCNLQRLACNGCALHPPDVKEFLCPALKATQGIRLLSMEKNRMDDAMMQSLCDSGALEKVEAMNFRFNMIRDKGAKALASCPAVKKMKWVNLKMNFVGDEGAVALANMLGDPECSMGMLNLRRQTPGLTDRAGLAFAEALRSNSTVERLRLRHNKISDKSAVALAHATGEHVAKLCAQAAFTGEPVRFELDLEENKVREKGAVALLRTAKRVPAKVDLELLLHGNPIANRDTLQQAADAEEEGLDASDSRLWFASKAEALL
jgi:hypothetical protein